MCALDLNAEAQLVSVEFENRLVLVVESPDDPKLIYAQRKEASQGQGNAVGANALRRGGVGMRAFTLFFIKAFLKFGGLRPDEWARETEVLRGMNCLNIASEAAKDSWVLGLESVLTPAELAWRDRLFRRRAGKAREAKSAGKIAREELRRHIVLEGVKSGVGEKGRLAQAFLNLGRLKPNEIIIFVSEGPRSNRWFPLTPVSPSKRNPSEYQTKRLKEIEAALEGFLAKRKRIHAQQGPGASDEKKAESTSNRETLVAPIESQLRNIREDPFTGHEAIREQLEKSYSSLGSDDLRKAWTTLAVFASDFSDHAAALVLGGEEPKKVANALKLVERLKTLHFLRTESNNEYRLGDLEREFLLLKLRNSGDEVNVRLRHAGYLEKIFSDINRMEGVALSSEVQWLGPKWEKDTDQAFEWLTMCQPERSLQFWDICRSFIPIKNQRQFDNVVRALNIAEELGNANMARKLDDAIVGVSLMFPFDPSVQANTVTSLQAIFKALFKEGQ